MRSRNKRIVSAVLMFGIVLLLLPGLVSCTPSLPSPATQIDWVNFVQFGGITYLANALHVGRSLQTTDLGPEFAKVRSGSTETCMILGIAPKMEMLRSSLLGRVYTW